VSLVLVNGVSKSYGASQVLRQVSLSLDEHERLAICGPSGSGKSTLLRCINGLEPIDEGRIIVDGLELTNHARRLESIRRKVGLVFQSFNLFPHLTVLENCTLAPIWIRRMTKQDAADLATSYLKRVHVETHANKYPSQLSGGQQQRVAIARALCMAPKVLLFDEPTSALDPEMIREVLDTIVSLADTGMAMVCVTHEMGFARRVADRLIFMDHGEVVEQGRPGELFDNPRTERLKVFLSQILHGQQPMSSQP
jgi:general L-amino acid transport system ATP-binding protein